MAVRYSSKNLDTLTNRAFFFDTNVLIYLYYPTTGWEVAQYSKLFSDMLKKKVRMFVDPNVISEFINRVIRIEYKNSRSVLDFKKYRNSPDGQKVVIQAYDLVKLIVKQFDMDGQIISKEELKALLTVDSLDFNDKLIENICLNKKYILVTNDLDFQKSNVDILTAHRGFGV